MLSFLKSFFCLTEFFTKLHYISGQVKTASKLIKTHSLLSAPTEHLTNGGALIPAGRQCDCPKTSIHQVPVSPGSESIVQPSNWSLLSFLPHHLNKMAFNILLPDQDGYSKSEWDRKKLWVVSLFISHHFPLKEASQYRGTRVRDQLKGMAALKDGLIRETFFFTVVTIQLCIRPFLLKNHRAREGKDSFFNCKFNEHLLLPRHCSGCWGFSGEQKRKTPCPHRASDYEETDNKKEKKHTENVRQY